MKKKLLLLTLAALCAAGISAKKGINIGVEAGYDFAHYRQTHATVTETIEGSTNTKTAIVNYQHSQQIDTYIETFINGVYKKGDVASTPTNRLPQMHGFHVGPTFDWRFAESHGLGLRFALQYQFLTTNGNVFDTKEDREFQQELKSSINTYMHSLDVPVRLSYTWTVKNDWSIWLMTGPKFNIGLSYTTNLKKEGVNSTLNLYTGELTVNGSKIQNPDYDGKYIPFDASWGLGFGFGYKNFNFSACYDLGITDMLGYQTYGQSTQFGTTTYYSHTAYNNQLQVTLSYTWPVKKSASTAK